jgi:hypothetical protein
MGKNLLDLPEGLFVGTPRRGKCFKKQDGAQQQDLFDAHPVLLKHLRLRGDYVRITLNKSRPSSKKQTYGCSMLVLSTAHPRSETGGKRSVHSSDLFSTRRR